MNNFYEKRLCFDIGKYECPNLGSGFESANIIGTTYVYQGIIADQKAGRYYVQDWNTALFLLEKEFKPITEVNRSKITGLNLKVLTAIYAILYKYDLLDSEQGENIYQLLKLKNITLGEWREVGESCVGQWIERNQNETIEKFIHKLQKRNNYDEGFFTTCNLKQVMNRYLMAYLQDHYHMTINYENGQIIKFYDKEKDELGHIYDIFPPIMFCEAASEQSRKYICHGIVYYRVGITTDHPFITWLLEHAVQLNKNFQRQFQQLINCICDKDGKDIIQIYNVIREQICSMSNKYGLDVKSMPQLTMGDFWTFEQESEKQCPF